MVKFWARVEFWVKVKFLGQSQILGQGRGQCLCVWMHLASLLTAPMAPLADQFANIYMYTMSYKQASKQIKQARQVNIKDLKKLVPIAFVYLDDGWNADKNCGTLLFYQTWDWH